MFDFHSYAKPRFDLVNGRLELRGIPVRDPASFRRYSLPHIVNYAVMFGQFLTETREEYSIRRYLLGTAILEAMGRTIREAGSSFVLLNLLPSDDPVYRDYCRRHLGEVHCVDAGPAVLAFRRNTPDSEGHFRCHVSPAVHDLIADLAARALRNLHLVPSRESGVTTAKNASRGASPPGAIGGERENGARGGPGPAAME